MPYGVEDMNMNSVGSSVPTGNAPSGPGTELDRLLQERERVRRELQRLQETAEKLDAKARELHDALAAQIHGKEELKSY